MKKILAFYSLKGLSFNYLSNPLFPLININVIPDSETTGEMLWCSQGSLILSNLLCVFLKQPKTFLCDMGRQRFY